MTQEHSAQDPLEFVRGMWNSMGFSLPGMMTPTLDVDELDKRIADLKAVEGWLKMNLNMLQMTTQGLEIQRATIAAVKAMGRQAEGEPAGEANPFAAAAMWPWQMMAQAAAEASESAATEPPTAGDRPTEPPAARARATKK